ncbi:hypothetical protein [uncultured Methanosphaera sp.]|jgi:hypothetical protein|uniref:hypothetical protein n=1 Tax=uncultured Methanosphaera sp. TaxID=262501 RepID=UPI0025971FE8|nr:hypothetical protein [uncultured Methanosphaera sp.]
MECPFCGFENENDESVCNSCGKTMDFPLNNSNIENSQPKVDKNRTSIDNNNQPNNKVDVHYYPNNNEYNNQNQYQNNQGYNNQNPNNYPNNQGYNNQNLNYYPNNQGYNNQNPNNYPNNQGYNNQYNRPYNTKSKGIGLLLGFLITGAGLCYVDKWADGIAMFFLCWILNIIGVLTLGLGFIPAIALWIYSLIKTSEYIDAYNEGRPY